MSATVNNPTFEATGGVANAGKKEISKRLSESELFHGIYIGPRRPICSELSSNTEAIQQSLPNCPIHISPEIHDIDVQYTRQTSQNTISQEERAHKVFSDVRENPDCLIVAHSDEDDQETDRSDVFAPPTKAIFEECAAASVATGEEGTSASNNPELVSGIIVQQNTLSAQSKLAISKKGKYESILHHKVLALLTI